MSRNASGNYSLPVPETPFISRTVINSTDMNTVMSDIGTEMTDSLSRSGKGGMTAPLRGPDGSAAFPALSFTSDTDTGLYSVGANTLGFSTGGTVRAQMSANGLLTVDGALSTPALSFISDTNTGIYRAGSDDLRIVAGGVAIATATTKLSIAAATAATGGTRQDALTISNGDIDMSGVTYPTSTTAMANRLGPMHFPKAWTVITITGAATFTITQAVGCNVASVARTSASTFTITFGSGFTSTTYGLTATCLSQNLGSGADVTLDSSGITRNTGSLVAGLSVNGTSVASLDNWGPNNVAILTVVFWGQQ